jgi:hypothetical protein
VATRTANSLRLIARTSYLLSLKKFNVSFSAGIIFPFISSTKEEYYVKDSLQESKTVYSMKNFVTLGFNGSIGISKQVTPKIRLFLNSDINILNHSVKSRKVSSYENSKGKTTAEAYPDLSSMETIYHKKLTEIRNNKDLPVPVFNKDKPTDKLAYRVSDSSIGLQFGFLFLF